MQFPWKWHLCQGGSIAKNVFLDSPSVCAKFQVGNKKCTIQPKFRAMPPDYILSCVCLNILALFRPGFFRLSGTGGGAM